MGFKFDTKEDVATKQGDETLVRINGIARIAPKAKAIMEARKAKKDSK